MNKRNLIAYVILLFSADEWSCSPSIVVMKVFLSQEWDSENAIAHITIWTIRIESFLIEDFCKGFSILTFEVEKSWDENSALHY